MPWRDALAPARMARVALVAPEGSLRDMLVAIAVSATVEIDDRGADQSLSAEPHLPQARAVSALAEHAPVPVLSASPPDLAELERLGRYDLRAGEDELSAHARAAVRGQGAAALAGWIPADRLAGVTARLAGLGCAAVPLPYPPGAQAPTLLGGSAARRGLAPLVSTYGTVPYADIDPAWLAWASYVVMFGMMFGDAGHGLLLVAAALCLRAGWPRWVPGLRGAWPFVAGAGVAATVFGFAYGEFFGPTGVVPALWLEPLSQPIPLLVASVGVGAVLLACAYALGTVNRCREGGWRLALYAPSGIAGSALFLGLGLAAGGWYIHHDVLLAAGAVVAVAGLGLAFAGFAAESGGGGTGIVQASVELFDLVVRLGSNVVSFARLAAFGLTHAAIGLLIWEGTQALWHQGGLMYVLAVGLFVVGNAVAFALEALVAAIQALRLEYYELFSRVFVTQGQIFRPWCVPVLTSAGTPAVTENPFPAGTGDLIQRKKSA
jgi:V/A-type H+/Na+-transporting ATPase subunit I